MSESVFNTQVYASVARKAQAEGIVMLENRDNALPLKKGSRIALFGRSQFRYYKSGTGSGGMVNTTYVTGVREAILEREAYVLAPSLEKAYEEWLPDHPFDEGCGWGTEPWFQEEMEPSEELVRAAAGEAEAAVVIIGRTAGEDQDNKPEGGSYYLTGTEETMLERVCAAFPRTIVLLNVGNIIDMKWVAKYRPAAVLYIWQGGQEGGNAIIPLTRISEIPTGTSIQKIFMWDIDILKHLRRRKCCILSDSDFPIRNSRSADSEWRVRGTIRLISGSES